MQPFFNGLEGDELLQSTEDSAHLTLRSIFDFYPTKEWNGHLNQFYAFKYTLLFCTTLAQGKFWRILKIVPFPSYPSVSLKEPQIISD